MSKYVAFLRAINVGGHTVKMDYLRRLFISLGFTSVETFIASGNVIFDSTSKSSRTLEKKIESRLLEALGYEVATFVRSISELADIAQHKPFPDSELSARGHALYIGFMADEPGGKAKEKLLSLATKLDDFHLNGREVYWLCRTRFSESQISGAMLTKALGMPATLRNSTTVKKIVAKYS
ncbi:MAG TPA: DUF1697 domain-containing protein [Pyrinomonadaceae bacterium]